MTDAAPRVQRRMIQERHLQTMVQLQTILVSGIRNSLVVTMKTVYSMVSTNRISTLYGVGNYSYTWPIQLHSARPHIAYTLDSSSHNHVTQYSICTNDSMRNPSCSNAHNTPTLFHGHLKKAEDRSFLKRIVQWELLLNLQVGRRSKSSPPHLWAWHDWHRPDHG
jgi:hypothetical protein